MKRYLCLIGAMLAAAATPALAAEPAPSSTLPVAQSRHDSPAVPEQTSAIVARLREALEARKQALKDAAARAHQDADGLCSDCPEKAATTHPHSASEERKADCIHCVEQAIYA